MTVDQTKTCDVCLPNSNALGILFGYPSAFANADTGLAPFGENLLLTDDKLVQALALPPLHKSRYVFRLLRPGYLHIYHPVAPKWLKVIRHKQRNTDPLAIHWETFRVTASGPLIPDYAEAFGKIDADFTCTLDPMHRFTALAYRLRDADKSGPIKAAFSANDWSRSKTLREQNIGNGAMVTIDVPAILGANPPSGTVRASGAWIDQHILEFGCPNADHRHIGAILPVNHSYFREGNTIARRMAEMDADNAKTHGKSVVAILPDPAGTCAGLADVSRSCYQFGLETVEAERQRLGTAAKLAMLQRQAHDDALAHTEAARPPMSALPTNAAGVPVDAIGRPLFADGAALPPMAERNRWVDCGVMRPETRIQEVQNRRLPSSSRWYGLRADPTLGSVYAPLDDLAQTRADKDTAKIRWLHHPERVDQFLTTIAGTLKQQAGRLEAHDADRATWLAGAKLKDAFETHYDPLEDKLNPVLAYQRDAEGALVSWGGITVALEPAIKELLDAEPSKSAGWALRALVGNQKSLYAEQQSYLASAGDWLFNMDNKLDKSYDTLRYLLAEIVEGDKLKGKWAWLKPAAIGLSGGLGAFLSGSATQLVAFAADRASGGYAKNAIEEMEKQGRFIDAKTGLVKDAETIKAMKREARILAWNHQLTLLLEGVLNRKPAARPVYVRMRLNASEAAQVLLDARARGGRFTRETLAALQEWSRLPDALKQQKVDLDFLTTRDAFYEALKTEGAAKAAQHASDVQVAVKTTLAALPAATVDVAALAKLYRDAHRFDDIKGVVCKMIEKTAPRLEADAAKALAGTYSDTAWKKGLSGAAALLQGRLLYGNLMKWSALSNKLKTIPNLTPEQRRAIKDELTLVQAGFADNVAGVIGGVAEVKALTAKAAKLETKALAYEGIAAAAGSAGALANAYAMLAKAQGKAREGDATFEMAYRYVAYAYRTAGFVLFANSAAIFATWLAEKGIIRVGGKLLTVVKFGVTKLPGIGWGITIIAYVGEGIVSWHDRTPIELWVEHCCFGDKPIQRTADEEEKAYEEAVKGMEEQAIRETDARPGA
jgi:hypothetical protein